MRMLAFTSLLVAMFALGCNRAEEQDRAAKPADGDRATATVPGGVNYPFGMMLAQPALGADAGTEVVGGRYELDLMHSGVVFAVGHMGMSYTYGRFNELGGGYTLDTEDPSKSSFEFVIQTASVDTANAKRDEHLRNADFFNAGNFPEITFKSTSVSQDGNVYNVTGDLNLHGVTKSVSFPLQLLGQQDNKNGFATQFTIKRSDYGMDYGLGNVGDEVALMISFEGETK